MIKHIVCFKLKNNSEECKQKAKALLLSMKGKVQSAINIEVGTDFLLSRKSYDVILIVTLTSRESLSDYQNDEYHCRAVKPYIHEKFFRLGNRRLRNIIFNAAEIFGGVIFGFL